jgi:hypothetical protein
MMLKKIAKIKNFNNFILYIVSYALFTCVLTITTKIYEEK